MLNKLELSKTFPKVLLYSRKAFLGVGLITPETVMAIAILKLYLGYKRIKRNAMTIIKVEEEIVETMSGQNKEWDQITNRYQKKMWIDQVNKELSKRNLKLHQNIINNRRTYNKTIMEYISTFTSTIDKFQKIQRTPITNRTSWRERREND